MSFNPSEPFNSLPFLPPNENIESIKIMRKTINANKELAQLKGLIRNIPNPDILINTLGIQEAKDSSEIENIVTTTDKLFRAMVSESKNIDPATKEVMGYREALWNGFQQIKTQPELSIKLFEETVSTIKNERLSIRTDEVSIGNGIDVIYTPPAGKDTLEGLLKNLVKFSKMNDGLDPLIKMAIIHYQFEAIHPFIDGNGRTGRIINLLFLLASELLDIPILYMSEYIINNKSKYYNLLRGVTENSNWEPWILYMLDCVEKTANSVIIRINIIHEQMNKTTKHIKRKIPNIYSKELVETIFKHPYTKISFLVRDEIAERKTASKYLNQLAEAGIMEKITIGRENYYLNLDLYTLLRMSIPMDI